MEIVQDSVGMRSQKISIIDQYKMWKHSLHKWDPWIANRHLKDKKTIDSWCQFILNSCYGNVGVYNSGGMFFKDFKQDVIVIEHTRCPIQVDGMQYLEDNNNFNDNFDILIMINPIALKYQHSLIDFFTKEGISRAGFKPNILNWVKNQGKIFLSFSDWHVHFNRLKLLPNEFIEQQINDLQQIGLRCFFKDITKSQNDVENGNIKLGFIKEKF